MRRLLLILLFVSCGILSRAQQTQDLLEDLIAYLAENSEEELDVEELISTWEYYLKHPVNINVVHFQELKELRILNDFQIDKLLEQRDRTGRFLSIYELASIEGFSSGLLTKLQPFLLFGEKEESGLKKNIAEGEVLSRAGSLIEREKGYSAENGYTGSALKYCLRAKYSWNSWNAGFLGEKDAGEPFLRSSAKTGFDYNSFFVNKSLGRSGSRLFLGDYIVRAGQGLVIWQGFGSGKSTQIDQVCRFGQGIRSYSSSDENRFMRGVATEMKFTHFKVSAFHSYKNVDANLENQGGQTVFTSLQTSGLHRTAAEIDDKHSVAQSVSGLLLNFQRDRFSVGFSGLYTAFDKPMVPEDRLSNQFLFNGKSLANWGLDYRWSLRNMFFFGECAMSSRGGWACSSGAVLKPNDRLMFSLLFRNFSLRYNSLFAQAVSESSRVNDEQGIYAGLRFLPLPHVTVAAYGDYYRFRWLKYQTVAPANGFESFIQLEYSPDKRIRFLLRYFSEEKETQQTGPVVKMNVLERIQKFRAGFDFQLNEQLSLKSKLEYSCFGEDEKECGLLLLQDINYQFATFPLRFQLRFAWFDTDSYNCRIYAYENDVLYGYSVPALAGKGIRSYVNMKYELSKNIDLWFRLSETQYAHESAVGSGLTEIEGDRKTEWKLQVRFRF